MGGYGSGRTGGWPTIEATGSFVLDVNRLLTPIMRAIRQSGLSDVPADRTVTLGPFVRRWTREGDTAPLAELSIIVTLGACWGEVVLDYNIEHLTQPTGLQRQRVELIATPCRFGGVRWWWICPITGRRCAKLYLPNGGKLFLSRGPGAYRLGYASQRGTALNRAHGRARRLYRRLDSDYPASGEVWPGKPKWMHWRTYERIVAELEDCEDQIDRTWLEGTARWLARVKQTQGQDFPKAR